MFYDEEPEENEESIEELLRIYESVKTGEPIRFLEEEEYNAIVTFFVESSNPDSAMEAIDLGSTLHPFSTDLLLYKAEILFDDTKYGQALQVLDQIDNFDNNNVNAILLRSDIYQEQEKPHLAKKLLSEKAEVLGKEDSVELLHELVDVYEADNEFKEIFETLSKILEKDPKNDDALHRICFWADLANLNEESIQLHQRLIDADPYNKLAWYNLGAACHGIKDFKNAVEAYEYCIAIDEKFEAAYRNMAEACMRLRWYEKAIESLKTNLELSKPEDIIYEAIAYCYERLKDYDTARLYYRQVLDMNPSDDDIFFKIGNTYFIQEDYDNAIKCFISAVNIDDANANYHVALGNCLMATEQEEQAIVFFQSAININPNYKTAYIALVSALYAVGEYEFLLDHIDDAEEEVGSVSDLSYIRTAALFKLGKIKEGMLCLEVSLKMAPSKFKILLKMQPDILMRKQVADLVAQYKKKK